MDWLEGIGKLGAAITSLNPIVLAAGAAVLAGGVAYRAATKDERERTKAFEDSQEELDKRIESSATKFDRLSSIFSSLTSLTQEYTQALEEENQEKAEAAKRQFVGLLAQTGMSPEDQNKAIEQFTRGDTTAVNEARRQAEQLRTQRVSEQQLVKQLGFLIKEAPKGEKDPSQEFIAGRLGLAEAVRGSVSTLDETQLNKLIDLINEMRELGAEQAVVEQKLLGPEANYEASNAQLQGALRQIIPLLNLSAENADAFGKALKSAGDVKSKELFKVLIGVFQQFGISANAQRNILQKLNDETDKAGKEAKSTANKTADLTEKLTNFSDSLRKAIAEQSLRNKLINVERNSLEQRTQLILDGNKKLLDKIRSQFTLSQKDLDNKLIQVKQNLIHKESN